MSSAMQKDVGSFTDSRDHDLRRLVGGTFEKPGKRHPVRIILAVRYGSLGSSDQAGAWWVDYREPTNDRTHSVITGTFKRWLKGAKRV